jgi:SAM-dependent methyltransferase
LYPRLVPLLGELFAPAAQRAADFLAATGPRILDVGAGAAPWSLALASRDPARHVMAVDLPEVISVTRNAVTAAGLEAQFEFVGADIFATEWEQPEYDLVLAANVCHLFDDETALRLLRCIFNALRPGGTLAMVDVVPNERLDGPRPAVLYALGLLLRSRTGRAYPFSVYREWLDRAGLKMVGRHEFSVAPPFTLITAGRP